MALSSDTTKSFDSIVDNPQVGWIDAILASRPFLCEALDPCMASLSQLPEGISRIRARVSTKSFAGE
jgi:hypothetical protein